MIRFLLRILEKMGCKAGELLDILTNPERKEYKKYRATIKHADFVTISIGSNDLLHLFQLDLNMEEMIKRMHINLMRHACSLQKLFQKKSSEKLSG